MVGGPDAHQGPPRGERESNEFVSHHRSRGSELVLGEALAQWSIEQIEERLCKAEFDFGSAREEEPGACVEDRIAEQACLHEVGAGNSEVRQGRANFAVVEECNAYGARFVDRRS